MLTPTPRPLPMRSSHITQLKNNIQIPQTIDEDEDDDDDGGTQTIKYLLNYSDGSKIRTGTRM